MKKKIIYIVGGILLTVLVIVGIILLVNRGGNGINLSKYPDTLLGEVLKNKNIKMEDNPYKKFMGGEILSKDTWFNEYTFITGNKVYIFDPDKLKNGLVSYKLVYTIPSNIKIVNIGTPYGADIYFYSDDDHKYRVKDTNIDNDIKDEYSMFDKATYEEFGDYSFKKENYTVSRYKQKVDYDIICNMFYVKDNVLYDDIQKIEEYISVIDKIAMGEKESESLQNELDDKLDKFNIRDDEFDLMVNSFDNIDDINKRIDAFTKSQEAIIYDLEEKIKSNGDITTNIETYTEFVTHTENLIAAALLFNASKKVPPTPAGMIVKSGMIIQAVDLAANFIERRDKTRQTTRVRYDDFSKDINNAIYEVDTASLKIDDAFGKISDLRKDFMNQCGEYQADIKEFDNFIKMLDDAEAQLKVNKKMLTDYSYSFKQTLDKNNAKVKRLEEIRNND